MVNSYENKSKYPLFSIRPGLVEVQVRLKFGASGAVDSDGYGNTKSADDVVRVSGEEKYSTAHSWVKGLVEDKEWSSSPDVNGTVAPVTKTATGTYTIRFDDEYLGLAGFKWSVEDTSNTKKNNIVLVSFTNSDANNANRSSCIIKFISASDAAVDPDEDSSVFLEFILKSSENS